MSVTRRKRATRKIVHDALRVAGPSTALELMRATGLGTDRIRRYLAEVAITVHSCEWSSRGWVTRYMLNREWCDCGQAVPAIYRLTIRQLSADGRWRDEELLLCAACAALLEPSERKNTRRLR